MTLQDLEQAVSRGEEPLLTIRQVAEMTDTPYHTVRCWVYKYRALPTIPWGPMLVPRIRGSHVVRLFCLRDQASRR